MKKAFTLIELVFVIIVIGILSAIIIPSTKTNPVKEAAVQLVSHIRYVQHLALLDDKYGEGAKWYRKRWQIVFINSSKANYQYSYTIFSDSTKTTGDPNFNEIAKNPLNPTQIMTGGSSGGEAKLGINHPKFKGMKKLNIGMSYGITDVRFSNSCKVAKRLAFDYLGRPIIGKLGAARSAGGNKKAYEADNLLKANCDITLSNGTETAVIRVTPETGYVSIL